MQIVEKLWSGNGPLDRAARIALAPAEGAYRSAVALRAAMYDAGFLRVRRSPVAAVSVGNLTVGGTGKTPVSAWLAARLARDGLTPAIVLRGYGGDEPLVHARINPDIPVIINGDRAAGIREAALAGANVVVLDDAFQHRRAARDVDIVLVSADQWTGSHRLLPAGPWREPLSGIRRASIAIITRKIAGDAQRDAVAAAIRDAAPDTPQGVVKLIPSLLVSTADGTNLPASQLEGKRVLGVAAIGYPAAFFQQLEALGAEVVHRSFPDHHAFVRADIDEIIVAGVGTDLVVCTLKDAVKLTAMWPADAPPLWYVSQSLEVESGEPAIDQLLKRLNRTLSDTWPSIASPRPIR